MLFNTTIKSNGIKAIAILGFVFICTMLTISYTLVLISLAGIMLSYIAEKRFESYKILKNKLLNDVMSAMILLIMPAIISYLLLNRVFVEPFLLPSTQNIINQYVEKTESTSSQLSGMDKIYISNLLEISERISKKSNCAPSKAVCAVSINKYISIEKDVSSWISIAGFMKERIVSLNKKHNKNITLILLQSKPNFKLQNGLAKAIIILMALYFLLVCLSYEAKVEELEVKNLA